MNKNKQVLAYCPNFYKIINFEYLEGDSITEKIINIYKDYIFNVELTREEIEKIQKIDRILAKYISEYSFRKEMQESLKRVRIRSSENLLKAIIENILRIFDLWEEGTTRRIYITRWI